MEFGLKMQTADDVLQEHLRIKFVIRVQPHHLMGEPPDFIQIFPSGHARNSATLCLAIAESHRKTTVGMIEVTAPDGAVAGHVPEQISWIDLLPCSGDFNPATALRDEFDALLVVFKPNGCGMTSRSLLVV